ncbi:MAG TPA: hypothetical protein VJN64_14390 [Terriglobales bacterium]|nr:hypothetical protein [Terriglobales bacterium]
MSSAGVPNHISSAYEDFLGRFLQAAEDCNCTVSTPSRPIRSSFFPGADGAEVVFDTSLLLKKLPSRRLPGGKRLDVAIRARETLSRTNWSILKSTVYVNYFVVSDPAVYLVQCLHYDFVRGGQKSHPLFHLQLDSEMIPDDRLLELGLNLDEVRRESAARECWITTRIPTADMTFPSVLYCIAGDHLPEAVFTQFAQQSNKIRERLPVLDFAELKSSMESSPRHFKSFHWFAHMFNERN